MAPTAPNHSDPSSPVISERPGVKTKLDSGTLETLNLRVGRTIPFLGLCLTLSTVLVLVLFVLKLRLPNIYSSMGMYNGEMAQE